MIPMMVTELPKKERVEGIFISDEGNVPAFYIGLYYQNVVDR